MKYSIFTDMRPAPGSRATPKHYEEVIDLIRLADQLGYHTVWTTEQHGVDDGYLPTQLPVLAAVSRETQRIRLGTGVILLPLTHPRRVVEEACVVDVLSNGRLTLGVGAGNYPHEFRAFRVSLKARARLMEDGLRFMRPGLAGESMADGLPVNVPPVQHPIPLIVGGLASPAIDRAVRLADGHFGYAYVDAEEQLLMQWEERIRPSLERHGRDTDSFQLIFSSIVWPTDDPEADWRKYVGPAFEYQQRRYADWAGSQPATEGYLEGSSALDALQHRMLIGTPEDVAERLSRIRNTYPFDEVVIWPQLPGVPHELARRCLHTLAEDVVPLMHAGSSNGQT